MSNDVDMDAFLETSLVHMYSKCGYLEDARDVFDRYAICGNVVTWNAMIGAYEQNGLDHEVFSSFHQMQMRAIAPDRVTFIIVLSSCTKHSLKNGIFNSIGLGRNIHARVMQFEWSKELDVINSLINMYAKCGHLNDAQTMFFHTSKKNMVTWNAMVSGFAEHGYSEKDALQLLEQLQCEGVFPDNITFINTLNSYIQPSALAEGKRMHIHLKYSGFEMDIVVATALVSMYGRCHDMISAQKMFRKMTHYNSISWNAMIGVYIHNGLGKDAIKVFIEMQNSGLLPNEGTFVRVLSACTTEATLALGRHIHFWIISSGYDDHTTLGSALMHMYAKCGSIEDAYNPSNRALLRDLVSWNTMISSYAQHGYGKEALQLYNHMQCGGTLPNETTLINALYACSHSGLIDDAMKLLVSASFDHHHRTLGLVIEHFHCAIDLFGRVGLLNEAQNLLYQMPFRPTSLSFMILLGACRTQHDVGRGEEIACHMFELDPDTPPACVMLSNIYYAAGMGVGGDELHSEGEKNCYA